MARIVLPEIAGRVHMQEARRYLESGDCISAATDITHARTFFELSGNESGVKKCDGAKDLIALLGVNLSEPGVYSRKYTTLFLEALCRELQDYALPVQEDIAISTATNLYRRMRSDLKKPVAETRSYN